MRRLLLLVGGLFLSACAVTPASPPAGPPSPITHAYDVFAHAMDERIGQMTATEAGTLWGHPVTTQREDHWLRATFRQTKRPFPPLSTIPGKGTIARDLKHLQAQAGDGFEWPITTQLVLWFDGPGKLRQWELTVQDGPIYGAVAPPAVRADPRNPLTPPSLRR